MLDVTVRKEHFRGKCRWGYYYDDKQVGSDPQVTPQVAAVEGDPDYENNQTSVVTPVEKDPNKAPVVSITSPSQNQFFVGPSATVNVVANAYDPDGTISKVEFFDKELPIGIGKLTGSDKYELTYQNVPFGRHWVTVIATDDKGRPNLGVVTLNFLVNGCLLQNLSPGKYMLMAVATDGDGVIGKSTPVEVIIR